MSKKVKTYSTDFYKIPLTNEDVIISIWAKMFLQGKDAETAKAVVHKEFNLSK